MQSKVFYRGLSKRARVTVDLGPSLTMFHWGHQFHVFLFIAFYSESLDKLCRRDQNINKLVLLICHTSSETPEWLTKEEKTQNPTKACLWKAAEREKQSKQLFTGCQTGSISIACSLQLTGHFFPPSLINLTTICNHKLVPQNHLGHDVFMCAVAELISCPIHTLHVTPHKHGKKTKSGTNQWNKPQSVTCYSCTVYTGSRQYCLCCFFFHLCSQATWTQWKFKENCSASLRNSKLDSLNNSVERVRHKSGVHCHLFW